MFILFISPSPNMRNTQKWTEPQQPYPATKSIGVVNMHCSISECSPLVPVVSSLQSLTQLAIMFAWNIENTDLQVLLLHAPQRNLCIYCRGCNMTPGIVQGVLRPCGSSTSMSVSFYMYAVILITSLEIHCTACLQHTFMWKKLGHPIEYLVLLLRNMNISIFDLLSNNVYR